MFNGIEIISPSKISLIDNMLVIVAIEQFSGAYSYLMSLGLRDVAIFYSQKIYLAKQLMYLGKIICLKS